MDNQGNRVTQLLDASGVPPISKESQDLSNKVRDYNRALKVAGFNQDEAMALTMQFHTFCLDIALHAVKTAGKRK